MELHEIRAARLPHWRTGDDADDIALAHQFFFQQSFFGDFGKSVHFAQIGDFHGATPQISAILRRVSATGENATIGTSGRYRETSRAVNPLCVNTAINFMCSSREA